MDNTNNNEFTEELHALIAGVYSGGNSWAARSERARLQRRDDEGKFAKMFGAMRLIMLLNGFPVAGYGKYVGASTRKGPGGNDNMGWVYIEPDKNFPNGKFVRVPMEKVNMFDGKKGGGGVAILGEDYLKEKGIDPKNPEFSAGMLNFDDLESQDYPPGFIPHPRVGGAFISEDGDITIEPDGKGGWDVLDNMDRKAPARNVATLPEALEQVYEIDKTRSNYVPAEGEAPVATETTPAEPVASLPEVVLPDPAGMTNKEVLDEMNKLWGEDGKVRPLADKDRAQAISDEMDARFELEPADYQGEDWVTENPDFVRDASKRTAEAPVAEIPETPLDKQIAEIQAESIGAGTTYSILGADAPTDGYMVSHEAIVDPVDKDVYEGPEGKQALFDFVMKAKELGFFTTNDKEFVGVWLDTDTNKYYLDVSEHVADLEEAKRLGAERNQIAIWDIVNGEAINVGGTGERKETDSGAEPDGQDGSRDSGDNGQPVGEPAGEVTPAEDGGDGNQPPVAELPTPSEPEDYNALKEELLSKYPINPASPVRMVQRAYGDERPQEEVFNEVDSFIGRLKEAIKNKTADGYAREYIKQLQQYRDLNSTEERNKRVDKAQAEKDAQVRAEEIRAQVEAEKKVEAERYQKWLDNGGEARLAEFDQKVKDIVDGARRNGTTPDGFDPEALQKEFNDIVTVDGEFSTTAAHKYGPHARALRKDKAIAEDVQFSVDQALATYRKRKEEEALVPERLNNLFDKYDADGSARALFDSGASYDEIYQNLLDQGTGWRVGYDETYWAREDLRRVGVPRHVGEMKILTEAIQLRDNTTFVVTGTPDLTEALTDARRNGSTDDVIRVSDRKDAVEAVVDSIETNTPIVSTPNETPETVQEVVTEIGAKPELKMGDYVLNPEPSPTTIRRAKELKGVPLKDLKTAIADAIKNGRKTVTIDGKRYQLDTAVYALLNRRTDGEMFIAQKLDEKNGNTENVDALNAYRGTAPEVLTEGTGNETPATVEEALTEYVSQTPQADLISDYVDALTNGKDTVSVALENFGEPNAYGVNVVEISVSDFRKALADKGIDMDSVDNGFQANEDTKSEIAQSLDSSVDELTPSYRTDWKDVINLNSPEYNTIRFYDEDGIMQEFARDANGKWYNTGKEKNKRGNFGYKNDAMIRFIEKNADQEETIEITNERSDYDENGDLLDEAKNTFAFGSGTEQDSITAEEAAIIDSWRHVTYGDLKAMRELQKRGYVIDVLEKMREIFPNAEQRGEDELVTESHEWTDKVTGDKYRFEVIVTKTPNQYYYTYVRRINLTKDEAWSSRPGRMNQSALGLMRTYRREIAKFHRSFFKAGGPREWFESNATKRRMKKDAKDENGNWVHAKDLQLDRNTSAMILNLLGANPGSVQEITKAEDKLMREILAAVAKYRHRDKWMVIAAERIGKRHGRLIDPVYMYEVADAYDRHIANQNNLDAFGEHISFDQRTPLREGDTVEYVPSFATDVKKRGVVKKRLGFVNANGGYQYTDYILVQWEDGKFQVTTARNNRLIETADGTDGSERVEYKSDYQDPRADYGTEIGDHRREHIPAPIVVPKPQYGPVRYQAARNDDSQMVLEDGTVVPERLVGSTPITTLKAPKDIVRGDYISLLDGESLMPVQAVALDRAEPSEYDNGYVVTVATRQSDGSYAIQEIHYSGEQNALAEVSNYPEVNPESGVSAAQMNEVMELLGSKELPKRPNWGLLNYYLGVMDGKDMSGIYSAEEVSDIIQELRALPDREVKPIQEAADFARASSEASEKGNNPDASQQFEALADAADIVASQDTSAEAPEETVGTDQLVTPRQMYKDYQKNKALIETLSNISDANIRRIQQSLSDMFNNGEIDYVQYRWAWRYLGRAAYNLKPMRRFMDNFSESGFAAHFNAQPVDEQVEMRYAFQDVLRMMNNLPEFFSDEMLDRMVQSNVPDVLNFVNFITGIKENPLQFTDNRVAASYADKLDASYGDAPSARKDKARAMKEAFNNGYSVEEIQGSSGNSPSDSQNEVMFVTLSDGSRAVLKYLSANGLSEAINELTTGRTHEELGLATPSATVVIGPSGEEALLIDFVPSDAIQWAQYGGDADEIRGMEDAPKLAVMDLIAGNADRHEENWFYDPETGTIYPIDHGLGFNQTDIGSITDLEVWMNRLQSVGAWYDGFGDIINDFFYGNRDDEVTTSLLTQMEARISSLRDMYASMGMLHMYDQLIQTLGVMLGISRIGR